MKEKNLQLNKQGFGLIEIVIGAVVVAIVFIAFSTFILFSRDQTMKAQRKTEAIAAAEEAIEVVRKLRDDAWGNINSKTNETTYYPVDSGSSWNLQETNPDPVSYYTTRVVFSEVTRDATTFNIGPGNPDDQTRKVKVTVTWSDSGTKSISLSTYITNFRN